MAPSDLKERIRSARGLEIDRLDVAVRQSVERGIDSAVQTTNGALAQLRMGALKQKPDRIGQCYSLSAAASMAGAGDMVIGVATDSMCNRVWHAVEALNGYILDPIYGRWFAPGVYEAMGFSARKLMSTQEDKNFAKQSGGMAPDVCNQGMGDEPGDSTLFARSGGFASAKALSDVTNTLREASKGAGKVASRYRYACKRSRSWVTNWLGCQLSLSVMDLENAAFVNPTKIARGGSGLFVDQVRAAASAVVSAETQLTIGTQSQYAGGYARNRCATAVMPVFETHEPANQQRARSRQNAAKSWQECTACLQKVRKCPHKSQRCGCQQLSMDQPRKPHQIWGAAV